MNSKTMGNVLQFLDSFGFGFMKVWHFFTALTFSQWNIFNSNYTLTPLLNTVVLQLKEQTVPRNLDKCGYWNVNVNKKNPLRSITLRDRFAVAFSLCNVRNLRYVIHIRFDISEFVCNKRVLCNFIVAYATD